MKKTSKMAAVSSAEAYFGAYLLNHWTYRKKYNDKVVAFFIIFNFGHYQFFSKIINFPAKWIFLIFGPNQVAILDFGLGMHQNVFFSHFFFAGMDFWDNLEVKKLLVGGLPNITLKSAMYPLPLLK